MSSQPPLPRVACLRWIDGAAHVSCGALATENWLDWRGCDAVRPTSLPALCDVAHEQGSDHQESEKLTYSSHSGMLAGGQVGGGRWEVREKFRGVLSRYKCAVPDIDIDARLICGSRGLVLFA